METNNISQHPLSALKTNIFGERFLYHVNRDSFSKVSASVIFDNEFKKKLFNEDSLYIIIGTDSGLLPKYIQQQGIPTGTRYLFVELEDILEQLHRYNLLEALDENILCTDLKNWEEQAKQLKLKEYSYLRNVSLHKSLCAQQAAIPEYAELNWQLADTLENLHFQYTTTLGSQFFLIRQIQNLADNILPAKILANIYQDKTGIVLAGGPSLATILPWVKQNRSKLIIFAVSRISKILINNNIEPDFVISVDPQALNIDISKEMFFFKNTIFIHSYHVDPSLASQWPGTKLYLGNRFPWKTTHNPDNFNSFGSTVSNTALATAHAFGCQRILLAGFDLCYTKEGITHTKGSNEATIGPNFNTSFLEVETYNDEKRSTNTAFYIDLRYLDIQAEAIAKENKEVINLAKGAAKAKNVKHIPPEKIVLDKQSFSPLAIAYKKLSRLSTDELKTHYQGVQQELNKAVHHIKLIKKLAQKALKINQEMYNENGEIENYKNKRALDKIEKQINKQHRIYSILVKSFGILNFIRITSPHDESDSWTAEKAKKIGRIYYESYTSGTKQLLNLIDETTLRIAARLEEIKEIPDFSLLIEQWKKDKSYHRASMWKHNHPEYHLPDDIAAHFETLENQFQKLLNPPETELQNISETHSALSLLKTKAILLFNHHKKEGLESLRDSLNQHHAQDSEKQPYQFLLTAYIAELENDIAPALHFYNQIIDLEHSPLLEEALQRVALLSIDQNNHTNALLALKCLSDISPLYLPHYAEASRITGDFLEAIDSYNAYINFFPEDIVSKLHLANLYIDIKVYEAAELMLDLILSQKPEMDTALQLKARIAALKAGAVN